jgi:hypothetical protein
MVWLNDVIACVLLFAVAPLLETSCDPFVTLIANFRAMP